MAPTKAPSLAAQAGALATQELKLPAIFSAPPAPIVGRKLSPYITFAHMKRADEWTKILTKLGNPEEGQMYFIDGDVVVKLAPAKLGWVVGTQYWAEANAAGEVLRTTMKEMPKPFKEHIEAVVLCYLEDRVVPCNMQFRSTKCPGAKVLSDALADCQTPGWADKSPAHKETLVLSQPFCRFFGEVNLGPQRTAKSTGLTYRTTVCSVRPTGVSEWRLLKQLSEDAKCAELLQEAAKRYEYRLDELQKKLMK